MIFLRFLIDRKTAKLAKLDIEIKSIKDKLIPMKESEEYREKSQDLLKILEKKDKDQKTKNITVIYQTTITILCLSGKRNC